MTFGSNTRWVEPETGRSEEGWGREPNQQIREDFGIQTPEVDNACDENVGKLAIKTPGRHCLEVKKESIQTEWKEHTPSEGR